MTWRHGAGLWVPCHGMPSGFLAGVRKRCLANTSRGKTTRIIRELLAKSLTKNFHFSPLPFIHCSHLTGLFVVVSV